MKSKNTSLAIAHLKNHIDRIQAGGDVLSRQLEEIEELRIERRGALRGVISTLEQLINNNDSNESVVREWKRTVAVGKRFLSRDEKEE